MRCAAILVYCSVRDWTRFLRHRIRKYPDSPVHMLSDSLRIYFFLLWRADLFFFWIRCRIRRMSLEGSRIRKEKVADSKISGYVWMGPKALSIRIWIFHASRYFTHPSTRIRQIRQYIRKKINPLSRVKKNKSATNPITCGRVNTDIFESDDVKRVSSLSPNNKLIWRHNVGSTCRTNRANFPPLSRSTAHALKTF